MNNIELGPYAKDTSIIISGLPGSGKSLASKYFEQNNWHIISAGDILRELCIECGLPCDRSSLQLFGARILREKGNEYFASLLTNKVRMQNQIVFEGIRPLEVAKIIKQEFSSKLIYIECCDEIRYRRLVNRDGISEKEFKLLEMNQLESQVTNFKLISDFVIENNDSIKDFLIKINDFTNSVIHGNINYD